MIRLPNDFAISLNSAIGKIEGRLAEWRREASDRGSAVTHQDVAWLQSELSGLLRLRAYVTAELEAVQTGVDAREESMC